jgi:hypothetical protein
LPRPVYRAYDVGVNFNEDYVDLLYRSSGRDLNVYLFDSNNQPARDIFGKLLVAPTSWGRAERIQLSQTDRAWIDVVNASSCAAIDENLIVKTRTLRVEGQVLRPDTCYEARLIPLLLHETFANMAIGQSAIGDGATLTGPAGGWIVADAGTNEGAVALGRRRRGNAANAPCRAAVQCLGWVRCRIQPQQSGHNPAACI